MRNNKKSRPNKSTMTSAETTATVRNNFNAGLVSGRVCSLLVGCLTSQQHASESQGRICSDNVLCCHTEIEVADPTFYLTQSQYTDTGPTSPSTDPIVPGVWQGSHWSANFEFTGAYDSTAKKSRCKRDSDPGSSAPEADALTTSIEGCLVETLWDEPKVFFQGR